MNYTQEQIEQYKEEIRKLIKASPKGFQKTIRSKKYLYLMNFINDMTPLLTDPKYKLTLKIYWVLNDLKDFPKCEYDKCKRPIKDITYVNAFGTYPRHCSRKCANNNPLSKERVIATNLKRYHVKNTAQSEQAKAKYRKRMTEKYGPGIINSFQAKEVKEKAAQTKIEKHNDPNFNNRKKAEETCLREYGVRHTSQIYDVALKQRKKHQYLYKNILFDSTWEVVYYIYLEENNIQFTYHPKIKIPYTDMYNKVHYYFPDFKVNDKLIEIKGDDQIQNGTMIDKSDPSKNYIANAKYQCMKNNNIEILTGKDLKPCFQLIKEKFISIKKFFKDIKVKHD